MSLSFGIEDDNAELKKLEADVLANPEDFESWEKLVLAAESFEGGLNRNSSPQAIASTRTIYDRFLARFPLFFGYWKKYADLEFSVAGTEAAEMVYERGVASITNSVDLWTNYCSFKVETSHDAEVIRELFERGAHSVGLDFLAHPFWDKYLEFEERIEGHAQIFAILSRIIHIPMHQYARYFERFRSLASRRALAELVPEDVLAQYRADLDTDTTSGRSDYETERALRGRIDQYHLDIFTRTQTETTKRWTYEQEIKRPYFHVTALDDAQLANWRKYLDFEEAEDDVARIAFLYERCLVTCAYHDEFWLRFARWMSRVAGKQQEVRNIYERAACLFAPIARPQVRIHYALFEEQAERVDVARDIHAAILAGMPAHVDTVVSLANLERRHGGVDAALAVYQRHVDGADSKSCSAAAKGAFVAESAGLLWKGKGHVDEARALFQKSAADYPDVPKFWETWLVLELRQATFPEGKAGPTDAHEQEKRVKALWGDIMKSKLSLETVQELAKAYMSFLMERGGDTAAKEYLDLDRELFGPASVQRKATGPADAKKADMPPNGLLIRG